MTDYYEELLLLAEDFFESEEKALNWMKTENPACGGLTPAQSVTKNPKNTYDFFRLSASYNVVED